MREILFRVWNGVEMTDNVVVGKFGAFFVNPEQKGDGLDPNDTASLTPANTKYHDNIPVMQFTGEYDRNKIKIWEGDILKLCLGQIVTVKFINGCFQLWLDDKSYLPFDNIEIKSSSVIGNIYQNTKFLKRDK